MTFHICSPSTVSQVDSKAKIMYQKKILVKTVYQFGLIQMDEPPLALKNSRSA